MRIRTCKKNPAAMIVIEALDRCFEVTYWPSRMVMSGKQLVHAYCNSPRSAKAAITRLSNKFGIPGTIVGQELLSSC